MINIRINQIFQPLAIMLIMFLVIGCQDHNKSEDGTQLLTEPQKEMIKQERKELTDKIDSQMSALDKQIETINEQMTAMGTTTAETLEAEYKESMDELKSFRNGLETKKTEVANATEENWEQFKSDMEPYLNKVEAEMKELGSEIEDALTKDENK